MLILISPAKSLDLEPIQIKEHSIPELLDATSPIVTAMKKKSVTQLRKLMSISENIATLNHKRFQDYSMPFTQKNAKQALYTFNGDVYVGMNAKDFNAVDRKLAQKQIRILSGLYGILKPLDLIQPYRLEMGTKVSIKRKKNLYAYWDDRITQSINESILEGKHKYIVNLASNEYFKAVHKKDLNAPILNINFKELRNGEYKFISYTAKKARGMMVHYMIKNKIKQIELLKGFDYDNYVFNPDLSSDSQFIFTK